MLLDTSLLVQYLQDHMILTPGASVDSKLLSKAIIYVSPCICDIDEYDALLSDAYSLLEWDDMDCGQWGQGWDMEMITPHDSIFMSYQAFSLYKGFTRQIVHITDLLHHLHLVASHMPAHADNNDCIDTHEYSPKGCWTKDMVLIMIREKALYSNMSHLEIYTAWWKSLASVPLSRSYEWHDKADMWNKLFRLCVYEPNKWSIDTHKMLPHATRTTIMTLLLCQLRCSQAQPRQNIGILKGTNMMHHVFEFIDLY